MRNIIDTANNPLTTLGDFRTSSLSPYHTGKTASAINYNYDVNGNLTRDLNKDIGTLATDGIVYNHLNLPWQITVRGASGTKGTITYIYDATLATVTDKKIAVNSGDISLIDLRGTLRLGREVVEKKCVKV